MTRTINNSRLATYIANAYNKTKDEQIKTFAKLRYMEHLDFVKGKGKSMSDENVDAIRDFGAQIEDKTCFFYVSPYTMRTTTGKELAYKLRCYDDEVMKLVYVFYTPTKEMFYQYKTFIDEYNGYDSDGYDTDNDEHCGIERTWNPIYENHFRVHTRNLSYSSMTVYPTPCYTM